MTPTEEKINSTLASQSAGEIIPQIEGIEEGPTLSDTTCSPKREARRAPSSRTSGNIWLRYEPKDPHIDESPTQV